MRVVAGTAKGRRLEAPKGDAVRPTSDRVREAVFNALGSLEAVSGATVVDLFAGTGALGIEALSRGAASATFVERDPSALAALRRNIEHAGVADRATVQAGDALRLLAAGRIEPADLALLDPPYTFEGWPEVLGALPATMAVIESARGVTVPPGWQEVRTRRYSSTVVQIVRRLQG